MKSGRGPDAAGCFPVGRVLPRRLVPGPALPSVAAKESVPTSGGFRFSFSTTAEELKDPFFNCWQLNNSDRMESGDIMNYLDGPPPHHSCSHFLPHHTAVMKLIIQPQITKSTFILSLSQSFSIDTPLVSPTPAWCSTPPHKSRSQLA